MNLFRIILCSILCLSHFIALGQITDNDKCKMLKIALEDDRIFSFSKIKKEPQITYIEDSITGQMTARIDSFILSYDSSGNGNFLIDTTKLYSEDCTINNKELAVNFLEKLSSNQNKRAKNIYYLTGYEIEREKYGIAIFHPLTNRIVVYKFHFSNGSVELEDMKYGVY